MIVGHIQPPMGLRSRCRRPSLIPALILGFAVLPICGSAVVAQPLAAATPATTAPDPLASMVAEAAQRFGIPEQWIRAVLQVESGGAVHAVSSAGAMGLMQIMPQTWADLRIRYRLGADPFDVHDNITAGAAYLRELHDRYGDAGFLAAYNAGPARYEDHLATGLPLPIETLNYLAMLTPMIRGHKRDRPVMIAGLTRPWTAAPLFPAQLSDSAAADGSPSPMQADDASPRTVPAIQTTLQPHSSDLFVAAPGRVSPP